MATDAEHNKQNKIQTRQDESKKTDSDCVRVALLRNELTPNAG